MAVKLKCFYCYIKEAKPVISLTKPENFESLPYSKAVYTPNAEVAEQVYNADLTLMSIRKGEQINE